MEERGGRDGDHLNYQLGNSLLTRRFGRHLKNLYIALIGGNQAFQGPCKITVLQTTSAMLAMQLPERQLFTISERLATEQLEAAARSGRFVSSCLTP